MLRATNKNVEVDIADEKKDYYISMGYKITDPDGKVLYDPVENTDNVKKLKEELADKDKLIGKLNAKVEELKVKLREAADYASSFEKRVEELEKSAKKTTSAKK